MQLDFSEDTKRQSQHLRYAKIRTYLNRLRLGNFGSCKSLRGNLYEIRIHYGPGYRVYFGTSDSELILATKKKKKG